MTYTKNDIFAQLDEMGARRDGIVMVHTSLRSVGQIEGGGEGLLDALVEYFTAQGGLLLVPTHTWANLFDPEKITLDMTASETNLGAFSSIAARDKRALRSENPTHSLAIFGNRERAEKFAENETRLITPTASDSCAGKLFSEGGSVLLIGVSQSANTYLHAVDEILGVWDRISDERLTVTVKKPSGEISEREWYLYDESAGDLSYRFPKFDTAFRYHGCVTDGYVGRAPAQLCDAVKMKETVELIYKNSGTKDPLGDETPIPPSWYC
jgi:aminoglycoside 3-N-acetyltransferase